MLRWNMLHDSDGDYAIYDEWSNLVAVTNSDSEADADAARLICAAPELLEALMWYVENDDTNLSEDGSNDTWIQGQLRAKTAIKKARGE